MMVIGTDVRTGLRLLSQNVPVYTICKSNSDLEYLSIDHNILAAPLPVEQYKDQGY